MNRKERRTRGIYIVSRLNVLKNSTILKDADLKDIPQEVIDQLSKGECENKVLQKKYNTNVRIISEAIELEAELSRMKSDLASKLDFSRKKNVRTIN